MLKAIQAVVEEAKAWLATTRNPIATAMIALVTKLVEVRARMARAPAARTAAQEGCPQCRGGATSGHRVAGRHPTSC
jgi:hypothetical protein